jgi:hypothetical protein
VALTVVVAVLVALGGLVGLLGVATLRARRKDAQILGLLGTFGPVVERALTDPRVLLAWYPTAEVARRTFPEAFAALDQEGADRFPFSAGQLETAHAQWSADWLAWERSHDAEYRRKSLVISKELDHAGAAQSHDAKARLETLEQEKLDRYQRRYEEYVRVSRALTDVARVAGVSDAPPTDPS